MTKQLILLCGALLVFAGTWAQNRTPLTLEQAIDQAVLNSDELRIQRQSTNLAASRVDKRLTGQLPTLDAVAGASYTNNVLSEVTLRTFQSDPAEIVIDDGLVETATGNIGLEGRYMLYDGGQGRSRYAVFEGLSALERAKQTVVANGIIQGVNDLYHEVLQLQQQIDLLAAAMEVTQLRIAKLEDRRSFGNATELDILQAQTSLNRDRSAQVQLQSVRRTLVIDLNRIMGAELQADYDLQTVDSNRLPPNRSTLVSTILTSPAAVLARSGVQVAELQLAQQRKASAPTLASFANVGGFYQYNDVQQLQQIQTLGFTVGLTGRYRLNDGRGDRKRVQLAQIESEIAASKLDQTVADLLKDGEQLLVQYQLTAEQLSLEELSLTTYQANLQKIQDRFATGQVNEVTIRDAELAVLQSRQRLADLRISQSQILTSLDILMGKLVSQ